MLPLPRSLLIGLIGLTIMSCDPVYQIKIINNSVDTVTVTAWTTINFRAEGNHSIETKTDSIDEETKTFSLPPGQELNCGSAIAGIEDEMPFTALKIEKGTELTVADNKNEVLDLFEKDKNGNLETPYQIIIK